MSHITLEQRYEIQVMRKSGHAQKEIAKAIGKDPSVVSREIKRNKDQRNGEYKASTAQKKYEKRQRSKPKFKRFTDCLKQVVEEYIRLDYSPEQISGRLAQEGVFCVSHERIYQHIWEDKKKGGDLYTYLRRRGRSIKNEETKMLVEALFPVE